MCSDFGLGKLHTDVREFLACNKIAQDYSGQLEKEQQSDIRKRMEEASRQVDESIVSAYSILIKHTAKDGLLVLPIKQFRDSLDFQINNNVIQALKDEEWLLESVGFNTLRQHNLLPGEGKPIKVKTIYEAFLRYDDKPMIVSSDAVKNSLLRYCHDNQFSIASGDGEVFTKYYLGEHVNHFDVEDETYWLVDKKDVPEPDIQESPFSTPLPTDEKQEAEIENNETQTTNTVDLINNLVISGKVPLERYTELYNYFITPFAMNGNKLEIEISFRISSTNSSPLDGNKNLVKNAKEAARQLGLNVDEA